MIIRESVGERMGQQRTWLQATVERNEDNTLQIKWENNIEEVCIYWSTSPDHIEENGELLATVNGELSYTIENLSENERPYFRLVGSNGQAATVAERRLPLQGALTSVIWEDMKRQKAVK